MPPIRAVLDRIPLGLGAMVIIALFASACSSRSPSHPQSSSPPPVNPLTGTGTVPTGPVAAVKIDDTSHGRPPRGLDKADVVYVESAEGGLTRLVAIFATNRPSVEAVRSVRASDVELLGQYGDIILVASGGGGDALPTVDKSNLHAVIADRGAAGFTRDSARAAPYNLRADLAAITAQQQGASAHDVGFTWSATAPTTATEATSVGTTVGATSVEFRWDAAAHRYDRIVDGATEKTADGAAVQAPNVVIEFCKVTPDKGDVDVTGKPAAYTHTVGSGSVAVFRDGHRIDGTWNRPDATSPTQFRDRSGNPIPLAPGGVWVLLVAAGTAVTS